MPDLFTDDPDIVGDSNATQTNVTTQVILRATLLDYLLADADNDNKVSSGDTLLYRLTISNSGNTNATDLLINDTPDPHSTLVAGSLRTDRGAIVTGSATNDTSVQVHLENGLAVGESVTLSFQVKVNKGITVGQLVNQASITAKQGTTQITGVSDDPDTTQSNDATVTPLGAFVPPPTTNFYLPLIRR